MVDAPHGALPLAKARDADFLGRFREVVSDPINLLIRRVPDAGTVRDGCVCLHNGLKVPWEGESAYYGRFSELLVVNRGVHEPLEEFVFQSVLEALPGSPCMLELGAYWGHYSMWMQQRHPDAVLHLVEPDPLRLAVGQANFERNGFSGRFTQSFVGQGRFCVDAYLAENRIERLDVLHADIQGYEVEMIDGARGTLSQGLVDRLFISTHSQILHRQVLDALQAHGYRIEVSSDFDDQTTSFDGFVYAALPSIKALFGGWVPLARTSIVRTVPAELVAYLARTAGVVGPGQKDLP